jgi:hypothetical protein
VEQVEIYREQFFLRHVDCLRDDFQSIEHLVGEVAFDELARAYLAAHPPASFTLRDLGHAMAELTRSTAPWSDDPLITDLAQVEWAFVECFDGPDAPPFDPSKVAGMPEDGWPLARVVLTPSLQRLALAFPAHDYRIATHRGEKPERPGPRSSFVVVYRGGETLHCSDLEADAYAMLDELSRGVPLGEACERAAAASGSRSVAPAEETSEALARFQTKLAGWFQDWTSMGWIARVEP